jgi:mono/diheme cytochrome c family protein
MRSTLFPDVSDVVVPLLFAVAMFCDSHHVVAADDRDASFKQVVAPFIERYCTDCHGPNRSKADVRLDSLTADVSAAPGPKRWDKMLDQLEHQAMPPESSDQPKPDERRAVAEWIRAALRQESLRVGPATELTTLRRLTNVEYQNTLRDLFGFELKVIDELPKDPSQPYNFMNTPEFMRLGPEQLDIYRTIARRVLTAAIVDPEKPKPYKKRQEWKAAKGPNADDRLEPYHLGVWGGPRGTVSQGMTMIGFPKAGEFRVRFQASAKFPAGTSEMPLRLVMGEDLNVNSSSRRIVPAGMVRLKAGDEPKTFEIRGRMENFPYEEGRLRDGKQNPDKMTVTPQNLYDDGTLNDENGFRKPRIKEFPIATIDWMEFEGPIVDVWPPEHHTRILFESPLRELNPDQYVREVLRQFMGRAFRRPATDDEVARFASIYAALKPELKTLEATLRETLSLVLVTPQFLMINGIPTDATERRFALASRMSYYLWASMPDETLQTLAATGELEKPAVLEKQVLRMLSDPRSQDFVREFGRQWLSIDKTLSVPINRDLFPRFLYYVPLGERAGTEEPYRPTIRDYMLDETIGFVAHLIRTNSSVLNIVDSDFACLNQPLAAHYGVPGVHGDEIRVVPVKPEYRLGGLMTQGAVLIGNGTGSAPHPIYRAVWLREAILGEEVPAPPADVPALADTAGASAEKATSIKDLLVKHRQKASCNACHARLDPWGIPFEQYNAIGKFQPVVPKEGTKIRPYSPATHKDLNGYIAYVTTLNTITVHADAEVPNGPTVTGITELKAYLLKNRKDDIARNVLRRLYAYGLGRRLAWQDRFVVDDMLDSHRKSGFGVRDMIVAICLHDSFRNQNPPRKSP